MASINDFDEKDSKKETKVAGSNHTIEIKEKIYKIVLLNGEDGLDMWEYLMQKLLPSVGEGMDAFTHDYELEGSPKTFSRAFAALASRLDGKDLRRISVTLFEGATVDGKPLDFKEEFKGNYGSWKKLLQFALKENFSSFFEEGWGESMTSLVSLVTPQFNNSEAE